MTTAHRKERRTTANFAIGGLGRIGGNLARHGLRLRMRVAGFNRRGASGDLLAAGFVRVHRLEDLVRNPGRWIRQPRRDGSER